MYAGAKGYGAPCADRAVAARDSAVDVEIGYMDILAAITACFRLHFLALSGQIEKDNELYG
jgi:hypothetical protein